MLIMKESSYVLFRIFITLLVTSTNVLSRPKHPWVLIKPTHEPVCQEPQCRIRANDIWESVDWTVDPCTNFYQYACGSWQKLNPIPPSRVVWNIESLFNYQMHTRMRKILEQPVMPTDLIELKRAKQYYEVCSSLSSFEKSDIGVIRKMVDEAGPWQLMSMEKNKKRSSQYWQDIHYYYYKMTSDAGLFDVDVGIDKQDFNKPLLELKALQSPFGLIIRDRKWNSEMLKKYHLFLMHLVEKVANFKFHKTMEHIFLQNVEAVFQFRKKLEEAMEKEALDEDIYQPITIKELQYWFDSKMVSQHNGKINWLKTLNAGFHNSKESLSLLMRVNMKHKNFFIALAKLISNTLADVIANHLHLYFVERYLLIDPEIEGMISRLVTQKSVNMGFVRTLEERWEKCIVKNKLQRTVNDMYNARYLTGKVQWDVYKMSNEIKNMLKIHVRDSSWLDDEHKERAMNRIDNVKVTIGFPDTHFTLKKEYKYNISASYPDMSAFYSVDTNRIFISASYFQSPMYMENLPFVVDYATIGSLLGHELSHVFDKKGVTYPIYPKSSSKFLWSPEVLKVYEEKSKCIVEQYNEPVKGLKDVSHAPINDGASTFNENFADLMSLRLSYDAFSKQLLAKNYRCTILPNLKDIDCEKLFFVSYAITFCANMPQWKLLRQVEKSEHSVPELRVNIPVANMPEFSSAFKCRKNSYESSKKRCYLWD